MLVCPLCDVLMKLYVFRFIGRCVVSFVPVGRLISWENEFNFSGGRWCKCEFVGDRRVCVEVV
jgi:hypothetical protein